MTRNGLPDTKPEIAEDTLDEETPPAAEGLAALIFTAVAAILLMLAPLATRPQPLGKGWYLAPVTWPAICLGMAIIAGLILSVRFISAHRGAHDRPVFRQDAAWAFGGLGQALEYGAWFCVYLIGVGYLGFAIATVIFLEFVVWRAGLRGRKWMLTAFAVAVAIILIFRLGIGLWFPLPPLFKLLPPWIGNTFGSVL
jgi:hypothetical protein